MDLVTLAADALTSDASWSADTERIAAAPHVLAWSSELPAAGAYVARDVGPTPVMLCRRDDGALAAYLNVCSHEGARVAMGCGTTERFVCARHGWTYDRTGAVVYRPGMIPNSPLKLGGRPLRTLPVEERAGLVLVWLTPGGDVDNPAPELPAALMTAGSDRWKSYRQRPFTGAANWKLVLTRLATAYGSDNATVVAPGTAVVRFADHALLLTVAPGLGPAEAHVTLAMVTTVTMEGTATATETHAAAFERAVQTVRGCLRFAEEDQQVAQAGQARPVMSILAADSAAFDSVS
jgi:nitrite reductase/ring-hydroxylating ferredoxin subunit